MSRKELDRYSLLSQVMAKQLNQARAAQLLGLSDRQVRNLLRAIKFDGPQGIVSKKRGKPSNRAVKAKFKNQVMALVREKYPDFGPTFACEKLLECHNITLSNESLRKWMIQDNLWVPRKSKHRSHPLRPRRHYFGELIQIDASSHLWFEDRAGKCALIVFIDDATSRITSLYFCPVECLQGYFSALKNHLVKYGRPRGLYSDRHSIFGGSDKIHHAQFIRAIKELDIESILARSPQAKGRVERVNGVLQDRLVKEMRLRSINNIEDANRYLPSFMEAYNEKFSKEPRGQFDAHRPLASGCDLERILTRCEARTVTKDLCISYNSKLYKIVEPEMVNRLKRQKIEVREKVDGTLRMFYKDKELKYVALNEFYEDKIVVDSKGKMIWEPSEVYHPGTSHPWKKYGYQIPLSNKLRKLRV